MESPVVSALTGPKSPPIPPQISMAAFSGISPVNAVANRPVSEFDAGINTSAAWAEHLERESTYSAEGKGKEADASASDEENDEQSETGRPARAIYDFEGKPEFRELTIVQAGDEIEVLKEELDDGWSLVNCRGQVGLIPRTYYIFTSDFKLKPDDTSAHGRNPSTQSLTPRGGSPTSEVPPPLENQRTGEWSYGLPNFRQSLLGGKSLNRFSSFVTTGAEEWVLNGTAADQVIEGTSIQSPVAEADEEEDEDEGSDGEGDELGRNGKDADKHFVDSGPAWKEKIGQFKVLVHSPSKRASTLSGSFTSYQVTSLFLSNNSSPSAIGSNPQSPHRITVHRRFSHFVFLHTALTRRLPGIALPPLPEKQYAGRFSDDFVEARRGDLERYINRVVRHPLARYAEAVTFFLGCESEAEWRKRLPYHLSLPPAGPQFYAQVYHPAFNLDLEDAADSVDRFQRHLRAVSKGVQGLRNVFGSFRQTKTASSDAHRLLSYSILSLITSSPLASAPITGLGEEEEEGEEYRDIRKGLMNEQGGWCWREGCEDCLRLTKALQKTAESFQSVADLYDDNARRTHLVIHDGLKDVAHPAIIYAPVVETHRATLSRYKSAVRSGSVDDDVAARCETVLNTTMAEFETYHAQKLEDFGNIAKEHLDSEIQFYEQVLTRLRAARQTFEEPMYKDLSSSPRQPSIYERELAAPRLTSAPLPQPCPHVFDAAPMRPVSVAIQEGVGLLLGNSVSGRSSVFGRFW